MEKAVIFAGDYAKLGIDAKKMLVELHAFEERLIEIIEGTGLGEYDGNEFGLNGNTEFNMFMYGPDPDALFTAIENELRGAWLTRGGKITITYGPNLADRIVDL